MVDESEGEASWASGLGGRFCIYWQTWKVRMSFRVGRAAGSWLRGCNCEGPVAEGFGGGFEGGREDWGDWKGGTECEDVVDGLGRERARAAVRGWR